MLDEASRAVATAGGVSAEELKHCCAQFYASDLAKLLLGECLHPGGLKLTERLGSLLNLTASSRVLDVASGNGASALFLARRFGCRVIGIDISDKNTLQANEHAVAQDMTALVQFQHSDAERLAFPDACFDAVICECALCAFPNKNDAAREFERVLRPGGKVGISDVTRGQELSGQLRGLLAWLACIADAQPVEGYIDLLELADLRVNTVEPHDDALIEMADQIQMRLLTAELLAGLKKLDLSGMDLDSAKGLLKVAREAIDDGHLGYAIIIATKPDSELAGH